MTRANPPSDQSAPSMDEISETIPVARARMRAEASGPSSPAMQDSMMATPVASTPRSNFEAISSFKRDTTTSSSAADEASVVHGSLLEGKTRDIIRPAEKVADRTVVDSTPAAEAALVRAISFQTSAGEVEVPPHLIRDPLDARPLDAAHVANLAVSMSEVGLENAVSVRLLKPTERNADGCVYQRTRGGHRLAAARSLNWRTVRVKIRDERAEIAKLAEIDENLLRRDYTPLERAQAFAERLEAWAAAHPDRVEKVDGQARAKRGRPANSRKLRDFLDGKPALMGFAADTANQRGISQDTVERALTIYRGIPASQQARLHGTWIARNDAALRQLAGIAEADEQAKVIDLLLEGRTKSVPEARALAAGHVPAPKTPSDAVQRDFERHWKAATPSQRDALLHWLSGQSLPQGWTILKQGEG